MCPLEVTQWEPGLAEAAETTLGFHWAGAEAPPSAEQEPRETSPPPTEKARPAVRHPATSGDHGQVTPERVGQRANATRSEVTSPGKILPDLPPFQDCFYMKSLFRNMGTTLIFFFPLISLGVGDRQ